MLQAVEATIDSDGRVQLLENVKIAKKRRALVTILPEEVEPSEEKPLVGSIEIIDKDLADASRRIAKSFNSR